jgi:hypothetical protein
VLKQIEQGLGGSDRIAGLLLKEGEELLIARHKAGEAHHISWFGSSVGW